MNKKLNKKGFTLVELLAVIIVLAVIMVIAVPSVLTTMDDARKKSFEMYGQKVLTAAQTVYQSYTLTGTANANLLKHKDGKQYCINIKNLGMQNLGSYKGYVVINTSTAVATYTVYLTDGSSYMFNGIKGTELGVGKIASGTGLTLAKKSSSTWTTADCYAG